MHQTQVQAGIRIGHHEAANVIEDESAAVTAAGAYMASSLSAQPPLMNQQLPQQLLGWPNAGSSVQSLAS